MNRLKTVVIALLVLVATVLFPVGMFSFIAAETTRMQVVVYDEGEYSEHLTTARTVGDFIRSARIELGELDIIDHTPNSPVWDGMTITVIRKFEFDVQIDNEEPITRAAAPGTTAAEALTAMQQEKNIALLYGGDPWREIEEDETLSLSSWRIREERDITILPYETIENQTTAVRQGRSHIRQAGIQGKQVTTTSVVYIGGEESNRAVVRDEVVIEPTNAIVDVGTGWLGMLTDVTAPDFHYARRVRMEATAYTAGFSCTGKRPGDPWYRITASGREVEHGIVAVDRNVIPLGTRLYVENYGFALAADVGGAIRGYKIDLFMEDIADARRFGRRNLYVWILD